MRRLGSILVVAERTGGRSALHKAFILARHFPARIELFLCDAEHAYALRHLYDRRGADQSRDAALGDARRYLEALRASVQADDVEIALDVACESPAYEGIVRKVLHARPDLVVKEVGGPDARSSPLSSTDWHLIRTCPVPLMLTHGRAWRPVPRFAAAVDVSRQESPGLARSIAGTAGLLAAGCGATLDLIYCESGRAPPGAASGAALAELAGEAHVEPPRVHLLTGRAETTLPRFTQEQDYDVVFLGALTHGAGLAALVGTLTERLLEGLTCDCILVKPGAFTAPVRDLAAQATLT